jgi:hypothetical protein
MKDTRPPRLLIAAVLCAAVAGTPARAQDDDIVEDVPAPVQQVQNFFVDESNFDRWVFGNAVNAGQGRARLDNMLRMQIAEVDRGYSLTDAQKTKLELAGRGDIKRFFEAVDEKRRRFRTVQTDQQKFMAFYQELQPLQRRMNAAAMFGDGSFFSKALLKTLDGKQAVRYEESLRERQRFRHRSLTNLVVATIDNGAGLTADQRRRLLKLVQEETRPPKQTGPYDYQVVMLQLAKLPEEKVKPIFNEAQWRLVGTYFANARGMEPTLVQSGVLPDGVAAEPAGGAKGARNR